MKFTVAVIWTLLLLPVVSFAEDITLTDGTEYKDVEVIRVEKDGLVVEGSDGVVTIPMAKVPKEVQLVHPYVPPVPPMPSATPQQVLETPAPAPPKVQVAATPQSPSSLNENSFGLRGMHFGKYCGLLAAAAAIVVLFALILVCWFIAKRLIGNYAQRQKQREFDAANAQQFHTAYADFFAIWKLWNHYLDRGDDALSDSAEHEIPHASRWELLTRAYIAEGSIDSMFLKLSSSRKLTPGEIDVLGRFRQGFQALGQAIKNNKPLNWKDPEHPDYLVFKRLASGVAMVISSENLGLHAAEFRTDAFRQVTSGRWERSWSSDSSHASGETK